MGNITSFIGGMVVAIPLIWAVLKLIGKTTSEEFIKSLFIKHNTELAESVKIEFNKSLESFKKDVQIEIAREIEPLKADLGKDNINFQISRTEYIKRQYNFLEELYAKAYEIKIIPFYKETMNLSELLKFRSDKAKLIRDYLQKGYISSFYLDDESKKIVLEFADANWSLLKSYREFQEFAAHYDHHLEYGHEQIDETEWLVYSAEQMEELKKKNDLLEAEYKKKKKEVQKSFLSIEGIIKSLLYQPAYLSRGASQSQG